MSASHDSYEGTLAQRAPRIRVDSLSFIDLGESNGGMVIGVSESGLSFQGIQPLDWGQELPVSFKLPGLQRSLRATGQVIWLNDSRKAGGLHFIHMSADSRRFLRDWLAQRVSVDSTPDSTTEQVVMSRPNEMGRPNEADASLEKSEPEPRIARALEQARAEIHEKSALIVRAEHSAAAIPSSGANLNDSSPHSAFFAAIPSSPSSPVEEVSSSPRPTPKAARNLIQWLLAGAAALAIVATGSYLVLRGKASREPKVISQSGNESLGLKLVRQGGDWQVTWNRDAESVLKAIGGHLSITDGEIRKDLDLEPSELRGGSILYTPATNDLLVRLQLVGGNSDSPASESVRILAGAAAPSAEKSSAHIVQRNPATPAPPASSSNASPSASETAAPRQLIALDLRTPRRPGASASPAGASDAGSNELAGSDSAGALPGATTEGVGLNLRPTTPVRPAPASNAPAAASSTIVPAQLISGREPIFPEAAKGMGISGTVDVHFRIERDGTVRQATVAKGNPLLGRAALDAVLARRYRPATLRGVPVESDSDATFDFNPK